MEREEEGMEKGLMKEVKRSLVIPVVVVIGWLVFILVYAFLWSADFTFYQNLVVTFVSFVAALLISLASMFRVLSQKIGML